jgi:hypothetical protein
MGVVEQPIADRVDRGGVGSRKSDPVAQKVTTLSSAVTDFFTPSAQRRVGLG